MLNINDAILKTEKDIPPGESAETEESKGKSHMGWKIFAMYTRYLLHLNVYHFQTKSYGGHKQSDKYYDTIRGLLDKFLEAYQGRFGRIQSEDDETNIQLTNFSSTNKMIRYSKKISKITLEMKQVFGQYDDLAAILDEITAQINIFVYLLTFE